MSKIISDRPKPSKERAGKGLCTKKSFQIRSENESGNKLFKIISIPKILQE